MHRAPLDQRHTAATHHWTNNDSSASRMLGRWPTPAGHPHPRRADQPIRKPPGAYPVVPQPAPAPIRHRGVPRPAALPMPGRHPTSGHRPAVCRTIHQHRRTLPPQTPNSRPTGAAPRPPQLRRRRPLRPAGPGRTARGPRRPAGPATSHPRRGPRARHGATPYRRRERPRATRHRPVAPASARPECRVPPPDGRFRPTSRVRRPVSPRRTRFRCRRRSPGSPVPPSRLPGPPVTSSPVVASRPPVTSRRWATHRHSMPAPRGPAACTRRRTTRPSRTTRLSRPAMPDRSSPGRLPPRRGRRGSPTHPVRPPTSSRIPWPPLLLRRSFPPPAHPTKPDSPGWPPSLSRRRRIGPGAPPASYRPAPRCPWPAGSHRLRKEIFPQRGFQPPAPGSTVVPQAPSRWANRTPRVTRTDTGRQPTSRRTGIPHRSPSRRRSPSRLRSVKHTRTASQPHQHTRTANRPHQHTRTASRPRTLRRHTPTVSRPSTASLLRTVTRIRTPKRTRTASRHRTRLRTVTPIRSRHRRPPRPGWPRLLRCPAHRLPSRRTSRVPVLPPSVTCSTVLPTVGHLVLRSTDPRWVARPTDRRSADRSTDRRWVARPTVPPWVARPTVPPWVGR